MNTAELICTRRTIHSFSQKAVSDEIVTRAMELVTWAPNHKLTFPWRLIWIGKKTQDKIAQLAVELKAQAGELSETKRQAIYNKYLNVGLLIAVGVKKSLDPRQSMEDYASLAAGLQNAALYLWSEGLGSKWTSGALTTHKKVYEMLGIDACEIELFGFFWIGYPERIPPAPVRPELSQFLFRVP